MGFRRWLLSLTLGLGALVGNPDAKIVSQAQAALEQSKQPASSKEAYIDILKRFHNFTKIKDLKVLLATLLEKSSSDNDFAKVCKEMMTCKAVTFDMVGPKTPGQYTILRELERQKRPNLSRIVGVVEFAKIQKKEKTLRWAEQRIQDLTAAPVEIVSQKLAEELGVKPGWVLVVLKIDIKSTLKGEDSKGEVLVIGFTP